MDNFNFVKLEKQINGRMILEATDSMRVVKSGFTLSANLTERFRSGILLISVDKEKNAIKLESIEDAEKGYVVKPDKYGRLQSKHSTLLNEMPCGNYKLIEGTNIFVKESE